MAFGRVLKDVSKRHIQSAGVRADESENEQRILQRRGLKSSSEDMPRG